MPNSKSLLILPFLLFSSAALASCSKGSSGTRVLRVLNCEDYIYEYDDSFEEDEMDPRDMMDQFVDYWADLTGEKISYVYDTFDTNETMFNELKTGKTTYDVIVPSDYMIQKLISNDMIHKFSEDKVEDIWANISPFLKDKFEGIVAKSKSTNEEVSISNYAVPYMWGTVGVMYNPEFYEKKEINGDIHELLKDWDSLYSSELKDTFSIKDSVRDTYAVSIVHTFRDEIAELDTNKDVTNVFNRSDEETISKVKEDMLKLKDNAFGFECDSGKTDMTTQKIGANMCWSGDATWAITEARDNDLELYYSIPTSYNDEEGKGASNIWFDGLCMPESEGLDVELAEAFIEFMSQPEQAVQNCYAVGYTPGVAGDAMFDYMYDCYDVRAEFEGEEGEDPLDGLVEGEDYIEYDLRYFFAGSFDEYDDDDAILCADIDYVDRELTAQYPSADILDRLAIMNDFGDQGNARLLDMWESVRTNPLPMWAVILFICEGVIAIGVISYFVSHKIIRRKLKRNR